MPTSAAARQRSKAAPRSCAQHDACCDRVSAVAAWARSSLAGIEEEVRALDATIRSCLHAPSSPVRAAAQPHRPVAGLAEKDVAKPAHIVAEIRSAIRRIRRAGRAPPKTPVSAPPLSAEGYRRLQRKLAAHLSAGPPPSIARPDAKPSSGGAARRRPNSPPAASDPQKRPRGSPQKRPRGSPQMSNAKRQRVREPPPPPPVDEDCAQHSSAAEQPELQHACEEAGSPVAARDLERAARLLDLPTDCLDVVARFLPASVLFNDLAPCCQRLSRVSVGAFTCAGSRGTVSVDHHAAFRMLATGRLCDAADVDLAVSPSDSALAVLYLTKQRPSCVCLAVRQRDKVDVPRSVTRMEDWELPQLRCLDLGLPVGLGDSFLRKHGPRLEVLCMRRYVRGVAFVFERVTAPNLRVYLCTFSSPGPELPSPSVLPRLSALGVFSDLSDVPTVTDGRLAVLVCRSSCAEELHAALPSLIPSVKVLVVVKSSRSFQSRPLAEAADGGVRVEYVREERLPWSVSRVVEGLSLSPQS